MVFRKYKQNCTHIDLTCFLKIVNGDSVQRGCVASSDSYNYSFKQKSTLLCNVISKNESYEKRKVVENKSGAQRAR